MIIEQSGYNSLKRKNGFLVIEGVNGAGKTTVKAHISGICEKRNIPHIKTFEPGDTPLGKSLRELLLGESRDIQSNLAELFLFAADRAEHIERVIRPAIARKELIICDRFYYSTAAFQGYGRQNDLEKVAEINRLAVSETLPDLVLLLDLDAETGLLRNKKSHVAGDTFSVDALEKEALDFHTRIRNGFLKIASSVAEPFVVIDASRPCADVLEEVSGIIDIYLEN